ncbi:hypothetical protein B0H19DRAFT_1199784 [Mycena capillaripes]|nr:hypothetical protein B0H19DRAFT_1199784 [Mycena capillaripes]
MRCSLPESQPPRPLNQHSQPTPLHTEAGEPVPVLIHTPPTPFGRLSLDVLVLRWVVSAGSE